MPESTVLLHANQPDWDEWVLRGDHDFYHRAGYHCLADRFGDGHACLAVHSDGCRYIAWPYVVSRLDESHSDAGSVYGYSGPTGPGLADPAFRLRAWSAFRDIWAEQKVITLFTRFHPVLENHRQCHDFHGSATPPGGEILLLGRSVSIDLQQDLQARRRGFQKILRQEINASERAGVVVEEDIDWTCFNQFQQMYCATMERNKASERYLFSREYFDSLRSALGPMGHLAVARFEGKPVAALLYTVCNNVAQAHLTGIDSNYHALSPLKCLIDRTADLARSHGAQLLHLGAGRGGQEDSLYQFKRRFSSISHEFRVGRWILDSVAHEDRVRKLPATTSTADKHFFPAYRAMHNPVTASQSAIQPDSDR